MHIPSSDTRAPAPSRAHVLMDLRCVLDGIDHDALQMEQTRPTEPLGLGVVPHPGPFGGRWMMPNLTE